MSVHPPTVERLVELAKSKPIPPGFVEDRRSVYWVDKLPPQPPTKFVLTPRLEELVKSKEYHKDFVPDRPTSVWQVSTAVLNYPEKPRLVSLSQPKKSHPEWVPERSVYTGVNEAAKKAVATKRLCDLSKPRHQDPLPVTSESSCEWPEWGSHVQKATLTYMASSRLEFLAEPRRISQGYEYDRSFVWGVSEAAKHAKPTAREEELSKPMIRTSLDQDYDPYTVSPAAKRAVASPRIEELSQPTSRKLRAKKQQP